MQSEVEKLQVFKRVAFAMLALVLATALLGSEVSLAFQSAWSAAKRVDGYAATVTTPHLVADREKTVHAFSQQLVGDTVAIVYRRWSRDGGWSPVNDIVLAPHGEWTKLIGAFLDNKGVMHLAFFGPTGGQGVGVYYSRALASVAGRAGSWSPPLQVGSVSGADNYAALVGDEAGNLIILYNATRAGNGISEVRSTDGGTSWSEPSIVYLTNSGNHLAAPVIAYADTSGRMHALWTLVSNAGNGQAIYYSRLDDDQATWGQPLALATRTLYETDHPSIIEHEGELFVLYNNGSPVERWMRRSRDAGKTWSEPARVFPALVGENGPASLVHDGDGTLHALFANRIEVLGQAAIHGLWHSVWQGGQWSPPQSVVSGPRVTSDQGEQFDPSYPHAVVSQGNVLLVVWTTDPGPEMGGNGAWFSYTTLSAAELAVVPLPTPEPTPTRTPLPTVELPARARPVGTPSPPEVSSALAKEAPRGGAPPPLLVGVVPVIVLISSVVGARAILSARR